MGGRMPAAARPARAVATAWRRNPRRSSNPQFAHTRALAGGAVRSEAALSDESIRFAGSCDEVLAEACMARVPGSGRSADAVEDRPRQYDGGPQDEAHEGRVPQPIPQRILRMPSVPGSQDSLGSFQDVAVGQKQRNQ